MKKFFAILLAGSLLSGCASQNTIEGKTYSTYGLLNSDTYRNPNIEYRISPWSITWSIVFIQTIIVPVYLIGFDLYEPVRKKGECEPGIVTCH